jgi:hypothetical protein
MPAQRATALRGTPSALSTLARRAVNSLVQGWKKLVARALDWHVREQVECNRQLVSRSTR